MDGSIQVYYGNGRGKTTAALGLGIRAAGVGKQVIMVQFLKKKHSDTLDFLKKLEPELQIFRFEKAACGPSSCWKSSRVSAQLYFCAMLEVWKMLLSSCRGVSAVLRMRKVSRNIRSLRLCRSCSSFFASVP